ncbi:hypothetical protein IQ260_14685 [Leptolyngbya cf. ectocarpi LEGE 11479]|uniref:Uncharacterized protein n=1 Tax=Leptolyngbya cf. ectocarpi LEGE 11479 TaxID=1828722 RepID=A0A929F9I8_LEPEC|nr:hypothetical protein [Leptolyngbya ectocarpi]MBE9067897.1 hypothetical protein [Leptolyngbya cf. ectocarpi LEGE 11479]
MIEIPGPKVATPSIPTQSSSLGNLELSTTDSDDGAAYNFKRNWRYGLGQ